MVVERDVESARPVKVIAANWVCRSRSAAFAIVAGVPGFIIG